MLQTSKWKVFIILATCMLGIIFMIPNVIDKETLEKIPPWMQPVNLGLDLQGGSSLLLEVDVEAGLRDQLHAVLDAARMSMRQERIGYSGLVVKQGAVTFKLRHPEQLDQARVIIASQNPDIEFNVKGTEVYLTLTEATKLARQRSMIQQSIEIIGRRINEYGTAEPNIQQQGEDRILVQFPGIDDPSRLRQLLGKTAKLSFRLVHPQSANLLMEGRIPPGYEKLAGEESKGYIVSRQSLLSGESLIDAQPTFDQYNQPSVSFKFDALGGRKFSTITRENINRQLAIVLDNKVLSAPVIQGVIPGGQGVITGRFTSKQTSDLSVLMRAGALPAPLNVLEERTVGPGLGADSIAEGTHATVLAVVAVTVFMLLFYSFFGILANIAVVFNIILLLAGMSIFGVTLTLPGIAGIALTIGMAVDANVLINERIKEELRNGRPVVAAIDLGYTQAMATIIDSNLTTLIGGAFLYIFGSGPIRGFAVTLSMGIIISMFTAISLTRLMVTFWFRWKRPKTLPI
jgi:preprotein translocase subunit SecD